MRTKLIVGLGNPGKKYDGTRHNIGFDVLSRLARLHGLPSPSKKFEGEITQWKVAGLSVALLWPQTFMNLSGGSVVKAADFFKVANEDMLVVCDDFNLDLAKLRFRPRGSAGGQKGLADILQRRGTQEIPRLRVGVGPVPEKWDAAGFVLGKFSKSEQEIVDAAVRTAAEGTEMWIEQGIEACMNRYNGN
jgi:PTH1 family peptidyl-tRNA hydrolase